MCHFITFVGWVTWPVNSIIHRIQLSSIPIGVVYNSIDRWPHTYIIYYSSSNECYNTIWRTKHIALLYSYNSELFTIIFIINRKIHENSRRLNALLLLRYMRLTHLNKLILWSLWNSSIFTLYRYSNNELLYPPHSCTSLKCSLFLIFSHLLTCTCLSVCSSSHLTFLPSMLRVSTSSAVTSLSSHLCLTSFELFLIIIISLSRHVFPPVVLLFGLATTFYHATIFCFLITPTFSVKNCCHFWCQDA